MKPSAECGMRNVEWPLTPALSPPIEAFEGRREGRGRRDPHAEGFTLLEVMVAVMILGFVIVSLLGLKNRSMEDVMLAERMTSATLLAKRVMTQTLLTGTSLPLEEDGEFEEAEFKDYTWKKVVAPTPIPTVMEVRVAVLWKEGERDEQVELVSYE